jgi:hypothetical protein
MHTDGIPIDCYDRLRILLLGRLDEFGNKFPPDMSNLGNFIDVAGGLG